jgi:hypothetical protein
MMCLSGVTYVYWCCFRELTLLKSTNHIGLGQTRHYHHLVEMSFVMVMMYNTNVAEKFPPWHLSLFFFFMCRSLHYSENHFRQVCCYMYQSVQENSSLQLSLTHYNNIIIGLLPRIYKLMDKGRLLHLYT